MGRNTNKDIESIATALSNILTPLQTIAVQSAIKTVTVSGNLNTAPEASSPFAPTLTLSNKSIVLSSTTYPTLNFTSSALSYIGSAQTLSAIQMQIATDSSFNNIVSTSNVGTNTSWTLANTAYDPTNKGWFSTPADFATVNVLYFRIRHFNTSNYASPWSNVEVLSVTNNSSITPSLFSSGLGSPIILGSNTSGTSGSSTTWAGYTGYAIIAVIGGGGAGSSDSFTDGAGGGGSGYVTVGAVSVTPSMPFTYVTGARGYDKADAGAASDPYSGWTASSYNGGGSSSITIGGTTLSANGGGQAFRRTSTQSGGSGGSGGGGYNGGAGGTNGANGGGSLPGVGSGSAYCAGAAGTAGSSDDGGKWTPGAGGGGFIISHSGGSPTNGSTGPGNRQSSRGGGIGAGGGGHGRDVTYNITQSRPIAGGIVLIQKYW